MASTKPPKVDPLFTRLYMAALEEPVDHATQQQIHAYAAAHRHVGLMGRLLNQPDLDPGVYDAIYRFPNARIAALWAERPTADPDRLRALAGHKSISVRRAVAANPATPPDALDIVLAVSSDLDRELTLSIAARGHLSAKHGPRVLAAAVRDGSVGRLQQHHVEPFVPGLMDDDSLDADLTAPSIAWFLSTWQAPRETLTRWLVQVPRILVDRRTFNAAQMIASFLGQALVTEDERAQLRDRLESGGANLINGRNVAPPRPVGHVAEMAHLAATSEDPHTLLELAQRSNDWGWLRKLLLSNPHLSTSALEVLTRYAGKEVMALACESTDRERKVAIAVKLAGATNLDVHALADTDPDPERFITDVVAGLAAEVDRVAQHYFRIPAKIYEGHHRKVALRATPVRLLDLDAVAVKTLLPLVLTEADLTLEDIALMEKVAPTFQGTLAELVETARLIAA